MAGTSTVYFVETNSRELGRLKVALKKLMKSLPFFGKLKQREIVPFKLHFGEKGNRGHWHPELVKVCVDKVRSCAAKPFLTDTNVLYHGGRTNAVDHLMTAYEHGFSIDACGAPLIIADGLFSENVVELPYAGKHCAAIKAAGSVLTNDSLLVLTHFTGHMLTGFGGAIKNVGMGLAGRAGKQVQHSSVKPQVIAKKCVLCRRCIEACPVQAIRDDGRSAVIDQSVCVGCGDCVAACRFAAIEINWEADVKDLQERMVEYAAGILARLKNVCCITLLTTITKECDCLETGTAGMVEDIGIIASDDPLAVDQAGFDLVMQRADGDVFKKAHPRADYLRQLEYAVEVGLGSRAYKLTRL